MLMLFIGIVLGWILTNLAQGAISARYHYKFDGELYKDIAEHAGRCVHALEARQKVNGIDFAGCAYCPAVFVKVMDLQKVHYER